MTSPHYKPDRTSADLAITKDGDRFIIKPYALDIIWGGDSRYWRKPAKPEDAAELLQVSWLEVTGSINLDKLRTDTEYRVIFRVSLKTDAFGWADSPVYLMAKPGKAALHIWKKADLSTSQGGGERLIPPDLKFKVPAKVSAGEKLQFGMYEIWKGRWKGGLIIHEVIVEPFSG
ncbi:protein PHLOEM PROTEIN 2-LIKE A9-like [Iris pallida]|uniref:Protein PHLOEM PROTEIN 2-LIKE A9-like n=1 Tax=Iris pallida TaxID=29817 RepID=A0AAX6EN49_IRIPA|nr:protein PHLOEM PROTEIN 2-LIKE A9-like [Iris pallida]KAJ6805279.1 protein PHLOEM PROTEIN 2-LIKE A9-like [Iris pallida]